MVILIIRIVQTTEIADGVASQRIDVNSEALMRKQFLAAIVIVLSGTPMSAYADRCLPSPNGSVCTIRTAITCGVFHECKFSTWGKRFECSPRPQYGLKVGTLGRGAACTQNTQCNSGICK